MTVSPTLGFLCHLPLPSIEEGSNCPKDLAGEPQASGSRVKSRLHPFLPAAVPSITKAFSYSKPLPPVLSLFLMYKRGISKS